MQPSVIALNAYILTLCAHSRQPPHAQPQSFSADGMRSMPYAGLNGNALIDRSLNPFVVRDPNKPFLIMIKRKGGFNGVLHAVNRAFCRLFNYEVVGIQSPHSTKTQSDLSIFMCE